MTKTSRFFGLRRTGLLTISLVAFAGMGQGAFAQDLQSGSADPSRAAQELRQPDLTPRIENDVMPRSEARVPGAPQGAENIKLVLNGLKIEGATVYSEDQLKSFYADKVGKEITLADVYAIANEMTLKYRNDGYILTQVVVPPQTIETGIPTLQVVEGFVGEVKIQKEGDFNRINVRDVEAYAGKINRSGPLNARDLERYLLLINDLPGVTARSVLSPSPTTPGAADLTILVAYDPVDGVISTDNFGSRYLGPLQFGTAVTSNSLLGQNEALTAQFVTAPQDWYELAYGSLAYEQAVGTEGTKIRISGNVTDTEPGWDLRPFEVKGRSYYIGAGATHPFIRSRSENLEGRLTLDWRRVKNENIIDDTRRDDIVSARLGGRYEFIDTLLTVAANTLDVELSKGLNILGASEEGDANLSRADGDPQYTKLGAEFQRLQRIYGDVNLLLGARGQLSSNALLSSEEFGVGGVNSGRGFDPSEIVGDDGVSGRVELQWKDPYRFDSNFVTSYQFYTFYDIGAVWNKDATTSTQKKNSLASTGVGVRFDLPYDVSGGLAVALPLTRDVQTRGNESPFYYFNLSKRF